MGIEDEVRDHVERETLDNVQAGMAPAEARAAALRRFGNVTRTVEDTRAVWAWLWLERLWQDVYHAIRHFAKAPSFVAIAVASIALGTGANVAIFSAADALVLRSMAVAHPNELISIGNRGKNGVFRWLAASYPDYKDLRDGNRSYDGIAAFTSQRVGVTTSRDASPAVRWAALVSGNFFQVMGLTPELGRAFVAEEDRVTGRDAVTVISYATWEQEFGKTPDIVGRKLWVSGIEFTVIGVTPEDFTGTEPTRFREAMYIPLAMWPRFLNGANPLEERNMRYLTLKARLRRGVSSSAAQAELDSLSANLARTYPKTNKGQALVLESELQFNFERHPLDSGAVAMLSLLSMAVLGVACANVAGLLASRAPVRAREIALRLSLGASRARMVRQLVTESLLIALLGGAAGLGVGYLGILFLQQLRFPSDIMSMPVFRMDERTLLFSLIAATSSAFLFGLSPAIAATRVDLAHALKNSDTSTDRRVRVTGRSALVAVQVALSLLVVTLSVYCFQVFQGDVLNGPAFRVTRMAKVTSDPSQAGYTGPREIEYFDKVLEAVRRLPEASHASGITAMPLFHVNFIQIAPEGYPLPPGTEFLLSNGASVVEDYFATMEIPLLAGRDFRRDDDALAPRVAIVNQNFADRYWPGQNPIGKRFHNGSREGPLVTVVGLARNSRYLFVGEPKQEFVYFPYRQEARGELTILMQTNGPSVSGVAPLKEAVGAVDRSVPIQDAHTMEMFFDAMATTMARTVLTLVAAMGVIGLGLTMIGLYGLVSYAVSRRTREIGIRIAVGALKAQVSGMMLRQGMTPVWIGIGLGVALSALTVRILPLYVPLGRDFDARAYSAVLPALIAITGVAALFPSNRASQVDPASALRAD